MMFFLAMCAVILTANALPAEFDRSAPVAFNATLSARSSGQGFADVNGGTYGGAGGAVWTVWDAWALRDAIAGNAARIVYVRGRIDLGVLFTASPGVVLDVGSYKSIIGGDVNAEITGGGLRIKDAVQVIIRDIIFTNAISYANGESPNGSGGITNQVSGEFTEVDAVLCEGATNVWIDRNEFSDDPWIANNIPNNQMRHDGLVDIKRASNWISVTTNIFRNHNKNMLIGHSDTNAAQDQGRLKTTIAWNWFMGTTQRNPRVRYGEVHVFNNLYTDITSYGIGAGAGASIYAESNAFLNCNRAWRHPDGTPSPMGNLLNVNNHMVNSPFDAVPNSVSWRPSNYYSYSAMAATSVEAHVRRWAGAFRY